MSTILTGIKEFVTQLQETFGRQHRPLQLYNRLLVRTTLTNNVAINKHRKAFEFFCIKNKQAILTRDVKKLQCCKVSYSKNVYIDFGIIFKFASLLSNDAGAVIWKHLLHISSLVTDDNDIETECKKVFVGNHNTPNVMGLMSSLLSDGTGNGINLNKIMSTVQSNGILKNIISSVDMKNGSINFDKLDLDGMMNSFQEIIPKGILSESDAKQLKCVASGLKEKLQSGGDSFDFDAIADISSKLLRGFGKKKDSTVISTSKSGEMKGPGKNSSTS